MASGSPIQMIENYVYLYHTKTLIQIPVFPEDIKDSTSVTFNTTEPLGRSAPIYSYSKSGPRSLDITLKLHRDLLWGATGTYQSVDGLAEDYIDTLTREIQAAALPRYGAEDKMVDPPLVAVRFGDDIFCKGVVSGQVSVDYSGPILRTNRYALVTISFSLNEVDPYDAESVLLCGSYRLDTSLDRSLWTAKAAVNRLESASTLRSSM